MKKIIIDLIGIVVLYALFFGLIYLMAISSQPLLQRLNVVPASGSGDEYREGFRNWALIVMAVSLVATLAWYALAQWAFRVAIPVARSKRLIWLLWLAVTILAGFAAVFLGPAASVNAHIPALFYFLGGAGFYYLATILFSPVSYKYTPPGASALRFF
jgi:hypothetical protein